MISTQTSKTTTLACAALVAGTTLLTVTPSEGQAQNRLFNPPEQCEVFLTVQMKGCLVSNHWQCDADPEGHTWSALATDRGVAIFSQFDSEFQWLASLSTVGGDDEVLRENPTDPASLSELLETGLDSYDFEMVEPGEDGEVTRRIRGFDQLTGDTVTISGEELLVTEYAMVQTLADGTTSEAFGTQFVSEKYRTFFLGEETETRNGETRESDHAPILMLTEGDSGFRSTRPLFGCGAEDISAPGHGLLDRLMDASLQ